MAPAKKGVKCGRLSKRPFANLLSPLLHCLPMKRVHFATLLLASLGLLLIVSTTRSQAVTFAQTTSGFGQARILGPVQLDMALTPAILQPGDSAEIQLTLSNSSTTTLIPSITLLLPPALQIDTRSFPAGMSVNLQKNQINWLPVVPAQSGPTTFVIPVRALAADVSQAEQPLQVSLGLGDQQAATTAQLWLGTPPQISHVHLPSQVAMGQPIALRATVNGSGPVAQSWALGDGRLLEVSNPTVVFPLAGQYDVTLTVQNRVGTQTAVRQITVVPLPAAQFVLQDDTVSVNQPLSFVNQSGGQPPLQYSWSFGDGTTSTDSSPQHQYAEPGRYEVRLRVDNQFGHSEAVWPITVGQPPVVQMNAPQAVAAGSSWVGQANGDPSVTRFQWDLDNGRLLEGNLINALYEQHGDYYVTVTAFNEFGSTEIGQWITVQTGTLAYYLPVMFHQLLPDGLLTGNPEGTPVVDIPLDAPFTMTPMALPLNMPLTEQLLVYINEARRQFDLAPVTFNLPLSAAAQKHTDDMAAFGFAGHVGSDGSAPVERFVAFQYPGGYVGEATAWGFEFAHQPVEFWVNSPPHRRILLNPGATEVGVGFTADYNSPSIWYWTAEFGNQFAAAERAQLRAQKPATGAQLLNTDAVAFGWNWAAPLTPDQSFVVVVEGMNGRSAELEPVTVLRNGTYYQLDTTLLDVGVLGSATWHVELRSGPSAVLDLTLPRALVIAPDPTLPTATPTVMPTGSPTATPPATVTPRPTVIVTQPPAPINPGPPPLVTATPSP